MAPLLGLLTFAVVCGIVLALWMLASGDDQQNVVRRRMDAVRKKDNRSGESAQDLFLVRDEMMSSVPLLHRFMTQFSWSARLQQMIEQGGMTIKPAKVILISGVLGFATFLIADHFLHGLALAALAGLLLALVPYSVIAFRRSRRLRLFEERFPEALDLLGRAVRAGHAFTTGLEMISMESSEPVASEFRKTFEEQNFGLPLRDVLMNLTERVPLMDVRFFVTALLVQKETGGNLAEILDELSRVIRERFRIYREVQVRTAQGRLTALILIAMPPSMMALLGLMNPSYIRILFVDPIGPTLLTAAAAMQILGSVIIWKIIHIKV
ncbi:MAG: type II secretion system F family protein [Candidatus Acidiferrales bacterium]